VRDAVSWNGQHRGVHRKFGQDRRHIGQPGGDVVQGPGEQPDVPAGQVRLDPDAIQLPLQRRLGPFGAHLVQGVGEGGRAGREHRPDRAADLQAERAQRLAASAQRGGGHHAQRTAQHHGPADLRHRHVSGPGDGLGHHALQRALAQLAGQQANQEPLLVRCGAAEQLPDQHLACGRRTLPGHHADRAEPRVHLGQRQRGRLRRGEPVPKGRPAHADLPLRQLTRQVRHGDRHLQWPGLAQRGGQQLDLRQPGAGPRHCPRHLCDLTKQHAPILPGPSPYARPHPTPPSRSPPRRHHDHGQKPVLSA
jgi:hypothetical protein